MTNSDVASILQETADLIELTDGNPHRARAFARAARRVKDLQDPVQDRIREQSLTDVSGIGDAMADHITDILTSGTFDLHDELQNAVPPGLLDVLRVNGLGTKRTRRLWTELNVTSLDDLEAAAEKDRITSLSGFGAKTQQNILENVRRLRAYEQQWRLSEAWAATAPLLDDLRAQPFVRRAERTGSLRRYAEVMEQASVLVATESPEDVASWLEEKAETSTSDLDRSPDTEADVVLTLPEGIPLLVFTSDPEQFGTRWWQTTGSDEHRSAFEEAYGPPAPHPSEEALFSAVDLPVIPPELRENRGELEAAERAALPSLLTADDLEGCLHNHSTYSDGADSVEAMAEATRTLGYSYFGICDHSQSLRIADGLQPAEVERQHREIQALNAEYADFRIFHGIESDILKDGSLDYDEDVLSIFDFVVASVHTGFSMTEAEATDRVVTAVQNPHTRILGHPTGRLLLSRDGYPLNHERVIAACAEHDVAIELNANPYRLDLDWRWVRRATEQGVLISINPDAHSTDELRNVRWGVRAARKGWLEPSQCLNAKPRSDFEAWIRRSSSA